MRETILIAVKNHDQIEKMIPRLKGIVPAGTRVVFLLRNHISGFQLGSLSIVDAVQQPGASAGLATRYSADAHEWFAEERISAACEALARHGVEATVNHYTGSLRKAIKNYTARGDVRLIALANGVHTGYPRFVSRAFSLLRLPGSSDIPPVPSIHLDFAA